VKADEEKGDSKVYPEFVEGKEESGIFRDCGLFFFTIRPVSQGYQRCYLNPGTNPNKALIAKPVANIPPAINKINIKKLNPNSLFNTNSSG